MDFSANLWLDWNEYSKLIQYTQIQPSSLQPTEGATMGPSCSANAPSLHLSSFDNDLQQNRNQESTLTSATFGSNGSSSSSSSNSNSNLRISIKQRLDLYNERYVTGISSFERDEVIPALANRSYHIPGTKTWTSDFVQYIQNNHPIIGICCHHKLHPIRFTIRIWNLLASIMFGICITNCMWLWYFYHAHDNYEIITISTPQQQQQLQQQFSLRKGMLILWTVGGALHAFFDSTVWYIETCCLGAKNNSSYQPNSVKKNIYQKCGTYLVISLTSLFTAIASLVVVWRASIQSKEDDDMTSSIPTVDDVSQDLSPNENDNNNNNNSISNSIVDPITQQTADLVGIQKASEYHFLLSYCVELALALFIYYPVVVSILFSGYLGCCGTIPVLGGRPYEIRKRQRYQQQQKLKEKEQHQQQQQQHLDDNMIIELELIED